MTGAEFRAVRVAYGLSAEELITFMSEKHEYNRSTQSLYNLEGQEKSEVPERWVRYLRDCMGTDAFNRLSAIHATSEKKSSVPEESMMTKYKRAKESNARAKEAGNE